MNDSSDDEYTALALDTSIFDRHAIALEKGILKQLEQFADHPIAFLVPTMVHLEVLRHLKKRIRDAVCQVDRALREAANEMLVSQPDIELAGKLLLKESSQTLAEDRLNAFYRRTGAILVEPENDVSKLMSMYVASSPPFESAGAKKAEFPDAIALLSLEAWARAGGGRVLIASADSGWASYASKSRYLAVVGDLGEALAHFQHHQLAPLLLTQLINKLAETDQCEIERAISAAIEVAIEAAEPEINADSTFYLEQEYANASYVEHYYGGLHEPRADAMLVRVSPNCVVLQITNVVGSCEVVAGFNLTFRDPVDRDYVSLGSVKTHADVPFKGSVLVTLHGNLSGGLDALEVEAEAEVEIQPVEFGEVGFPEYEE